MHLPLISTKSGGRESRPNLTPASASAYAIGEINAYIAIRDQLLAEAERMRTTAKLARASLANDFVEGCLKPARAPYEAQCLPDRDAIRERKRCEAIRARIAELRDSVA